jgi:hypothetical protein
MVTTTYDKVILVSVMGHLRDGNGARDILIFGG